MLKILLTTAALSLSTAAFAQIHEGDTPHHDVTPPSEHHATPPEHHATPPSEHHATPSAKDNSVAPRHTPLPPPAEHHKDGMHHMGLVGEPRHVDHPRRVEHCHGPFWHRVCEHHWRHDEEYH